VNFDFDKKNKSSGVQIRYVSSKYPDVAIDFFVYPIGKGPGNELLQAGMKDFVDSLKQAEELGYFEKLAIQAEQDLVLNSDIRIVSPTEKIQADKNAAAEKNDNEALVASIGKSFDLSGKKVAMTHLQKNMPMQSLGYLFYRQLYLTKVRITIPADALSSDDFNTMADQAVLQLVTAIEARNIGSCSNKEIVIKVDEDKKDGLFSSDILRQLTEGLNGNLEDNCLTDLALDKIPMSEFEVVTIEYTPEDWGN